MALASESIQAPMPPPAIEVVGLSKRYPPPFRLRHLIPGVRRRHPGPEKPALDNVSFSVSPGDILAIIGPNGAGKSTLLRILCGLLLPSSGTARVASLDVVTDRPHSRRQIGAALSEDRSASPRLTVRQNLRFFGSLYGLSGKASHLRIAELAERLEMVPLLDRTVRTLSMGEKARVGLARALLHRPSVVLLDEVTRSLDPGAAKRIRQKVLAEVAGSGAAVLLASHDLVEVESLASRVLLLHRGTIAAAGTFAEIRGRAEEVFSAVEPVERLPSEGA